MSLPERIIEAGVYISLGIVVCFMIYIVFFAGKG